MVVFPGMVIPLFVGRGRSIQALEAAMASSRFVLLAAQRNAKTEDPRPEDIYPAGTLCQVVQLLKLPDGTVKVLVEGKQRARIALFTGRQEYHEVGVRPIPAWRDMGAPECRALVRGLTAAFEEYAKLTRKVADEVLSSVTSFTDPDQLAYAIIPHLNMGVAERQELLGMDSCGILLESLLTHIESESEILRLEEKIKGRVKKQMEKAQKEYYLNEQMRAIQKELGAKDEFRQEMADLEKRIEETGMSEEAVRKAQAELRKLKQMAPMSAEAAVVRNYLDWLVSLPWSVFSEESADIRMAEQILNEDHYGLEKVKERILEFLAVQAAAPHGRGAILCLVGPPGVGKTSLARSIARATGRRFVKMSLGGMRDEAEIRGHRRTYIGAMPGKIMQNLKKAGTGNPVFLLDEIDKLSSDFRGDPSSALLEVLDPEQNHTFSDLFLDVEYDLSRVMFIATANTLHSVPRPLLDRLEVIRIEGYLESEKLNIARGHLISRQLTLHGLGDDQVEITERSLLELIRYYTREAGVRNLEREIAAICRKVVRKMAGGRQRTVLIRPADVRRHLGARRFRIGLAEEQDAIGLVTGLAWTETGGDLLTIEVAVLPGKGQLQVTGKLGEVMKESAQASLSYVRSRSGMLGLAPDFYQHLDIHIHVPEGAIPKDGPSAGITMATALVSALCRQPVRRDLAMTGEITLRGRVLPIGGLKEKLLAARRGGITTVLVPGENQKDLAEISAEVTAGLTIHAVNHMDEVLGHALAGTFALPGVVLGSPQPVTAPGEVVAH
jgi:ATP-dependent Lon protease